MGAFEIEPPKTLSKTKETKYMALSAVYHFKDGTTGTVNSAAKASISSDGLLNVLDNSTPGVVLASAPVVNTDYVEFLS